jgi:catechol 2,3-dioxygenase-like lactoylglutathione lyase family enzyme
VTCGLHHIAYRCRDSEETRRFYEDLLGLPFAGAQEIRELQDGLRTRSLHTYFRLASGECLAFIETPGVEPAVGVRIALEMQRDCFCVLPERAAARGIEVRTVGDQGFVHALWLTDPNGYIVELYSRSMRAEADAMDPAVNDARGVLERWQQAKR